MESDIDKVVAHYLSKVREAYAAQGYEYENRFDPASTDSAIKFITELVDRRPHLSTEQVNMCVDLLFVCIPFVHDPHDWDEVGNVLALMDWYWALCHYLT